MGDNSEREFDVDESYAEEEDREGDCGREGCEDGDGDCEDEEEGEDYAVEGIEECHCRGMYRGISNVQRGVGN